MARFPRTEPEVMDLAILRIALAQAIVSGLTGNAVISILPVTSQICHLKYLRDKVKNLDFSRQV
jgi:hypothetical protein